MCTALTLKTKDVYFGRNLDLDRSYTEEVCVVPRNMPFEFRKMPELKRHYAMIGMATVADGTALFYDAANEHGLSMAGLNFPNNAFYFKENKEKDNIAPFEFIPWVLGQCKDIEEARRLISRVNITDISFSDSLPNSPLHWIISGGDASLVVESMADGLHIHENPTGVMTNNPPFNYHLFNLNNYRGLRADNGDSEFAQRLSLSHYCQGLGGLGLPGDVSSMSRFVRAVFSKENSVCKNDECSSVSQFFHILSDVSMTRGICRLPNGGFDITVYSSCINATKGLYYYTTYENPQISCVDMRNTDLECSELSRFPLVKDCNINYQN